MESFFSEKSAVLKTFALPKIVYPLTVLQNPDLVTMKEIKSILYDFLRDSKPDKIARNIIIQDYPNGGLKMIDIECFVNSLKASWVKRLKLSYSLTSRIYSKQAFSVKRYPPPMMACLCLMACLCMKVFMFMCN